MEKARLNGANDRKRKIAAGDEKKSRFVNRQSLSSCQSLIASRQSLSSQSLNAADKDEAEA